MSTLSKKIHSKSNVLFHLAHFFCTTSNKCCISPLFRILTSSALLLLHLFHHLTDSPRGQGRETVQGQVWTSVGHLLPACPPQDLPLHILKGKHRPNWTNLPHNFQLSPHKKALKWKSLHSSVHVFAVYAELWRNLPNTLFFTQCSSENTQRQDFKKWLNL